MAYNHQRFITLLIDPEIGKHILELESILWDFYNAGVIEGMMLQVEIVERILDKRRGIDR